MPLWATVSGMMFAAVVGALVTIGIMDAPTSSAARYLSMILRQVGWGFSEA